MYLGEYGLLPLEDKFHHDQDSMHGFRGAERRSNVNQWWKYNAVILLLDKMIDV